MTHKYLTSSSLLVLTLALTTPLSAMIIPEADAGLSPHAALAPADNINQDVAPAPVAAPVVVEAAAPVEAAQAAATVVPPQAEAAPAPKAKSSSWWPFGSSSSSSTPAPKEDVKTAIAEGVTALRAQLDDSVEDQFKEAGGAESLLTKSIFIEPQFQQQVKALMDANDQDATLKAVDALRAKTLKRKGTTPEEQEQASQTVQAIVTEKATKQGWSGWLWSFFAKAEVTLAAAVTDTKADIAEMASVVPTAEAAPAAEVTATSAATTATVETIVPTVEVAPAPVAETPNFPDVPVEGPVNQVAEPVAETSAPAAPVVEVPVAAESSTTAPTPAVETAVAAAPAVAAKAKKSWFEFFFGSSTSNKGDALAEVAANLKERSDNAAVEMANTAVSATETTTVAAAGPDEAPSMTASLLKARADMKAGTLSQEAYETLRSSIVKEAVAAKSPPMLIDGREALDTTSASTADTTSAASSTADAVAITINDVAETSKPAPLVDIEDLVAPQTNDASGAAIPETLAFGALFAEVSDPSSVDDINAALREAAGDAEVGQANDEKPVVTPPLTFAEMAKMPACQKPMFRVSSDLYGSVMNELKRATSVPQAQPTEDGTYNNVPSISDDNDDDGSELNGAASMTASLVAPVEDVAATIHGYDMSTAEHEAYVIFSSDRLSANAKKQINKTIRENIAGGVHISAWPQPNRFYYLQHPNKESFGPLAKGVSAPVKLKNS